METKSLISLLILLQAIINGANLAMAQKLNPTQQFFKCSNSGNFNSDKLLKDRDDALKYLYDKMAEMRYRGYESSYSDGVRTRGLCPPDVKKEDCTDCINKTIPYLKKNCPKQKEGLAWTSLTKLYCMVHYADAAYPKMFDWVIFYSPPPLTLANADELEKVVNNLANKLNEIASGTKYGFWSMSYTPHANPLYGSMQCASYVSSADCKKCLSDATNEMHKCCSRLRKLSGMVLSVHCQFWYAHYNFRLV